MKLKFEINKINGQRIWKEYGKIRLLNKDDITKLLELNQLVFDNLDRSDLFELDSPEFFDKHLSTGGIIYGCFVEDTLIADVVTVIPGLNKDNLGYDIGLSEDMLKKVVHLESVVVHPSYRGNGLQVLLCKLIEDIALGLGYEHFLATVHPKNIFSLTNLLSLGLKVNKFVLKYEGKERYIVYKQLQIKY